MHLFCDREPGTDPNEEIDEVVLGMLRAPHWPGSYDLITGLVGLGVYAVERLPQPRAIAIAEAVLGHLEESAEKTADGTTWKTPPEQLPAHEREVAPRGYYNLGLAHGVPGVVAWLAQLLSAGVGGDRTRSLLDGATAWLLAQQGDIDGSHYPPFVGPDVTLRRGRAGWCYGDASVGASLVMAGLARERPEWISAGIDLLFATARRSLEHGAVRDAGLCHGTAGLAHMFNRAHQLTGDARLRDAALEWYGRTLQIRMPERPVAGFPVAHYDVPEVTYISDPTFLVGASGVGLALLAAVSEVEPAWDRRLLLSMPRVPGHASD
jgi:hypothetical protein